MVCEDEPNGGAPKAVNLPLDQEAEDFQLPDAVFEFHAGPTVVPMIAVIERSGLVPGPRKHSVRKNAPREHSTARDHEVA